MLLMIQASHVMAADDAQQDKGFWYAQTSVYTKHYSPDPDHNNNQDLIGIERNQSLWLGIWRGDVSQLVPPALQLCLCRQTL
jgi:hypothetical protein